MFGEMVLGRPSGGFGISPLAWSEIEAWSRVTGAQPSPIETRYLLAMDRAYCSAIADSQPKPNQKPKR